MTTAHAPTHPPAPPPAVWRDEARPPRRGHAVAVLWALVAAWTALFAWLSVARHEAFHTGRFDVGNMVQAVWSTAEGRPLATTGADGEPLSRLGAHVDPILAAFAPLWALWPSPHMLLVAQAAIVALGALPAFWLGQRWLGHPRLALAAAGVYLLSPPLQWATLTEFHPVTLAAPLLLACIWAAETGRLWTLAALAVPTALTKEQVGLALAVLGVWLAVRHGRRRAGAALAVAALAWVAVAMLVILPAHNGGRPSAFLDRYGRYGDSAGEVALTLLTRPWEGLAVLGDPARIAYLAALALPLGLLFLLAPLLAAGALPELAINLLPDYWPQHSIEFHYGAVMVPFLVAGAIQGLGRLRERARVRGGPLDQALRDPTRLALGMLGVGLVAGLLVGPLPRPDAVSFASPGFRLDQYSATDHSRAMAAALALIPDGAPVSAGNPFGAHLSARERIYSFPVVRDAEWVIVSEERPYLLDQADPVGQAVALARLRARVAGGAGGGMRGGAFVPVRDRDGVVVLRRAR